MLTRTRVVAPGLNSYASCKLFLRVAKESGEDILTWPPSQAKNTEICGLWVAISKCKDMEWLSETLGGFQNHRMGK